MKSILRGGSSGFSIFALFLPAALYLCICSLYSIISASLISRSLSWIGSMRYRQRVSRPLPEDARAVTKRKRLAFTGRLLYMPVTFGMATESTVSDPSSKMSESSAESDFLTTFLSRSGRLSTILCEKVGSSSSISCPSITSVSSQTSFVESGVDAELLPSFLRNEVFDLFDVFEGIEMLIPCSFASWKKVLMVTPVPCARRHLSYCLSVSSAEYSG